MVEAKKTNIRLYDVDMDAIAEMMQWYPHLRSISDVLRYCLHTLHTNEGAERASQQGASSRKPFPTPEELAAKAQEIIDNAPPGRFPYGAHFDPEYGIVENPPPTDAPPEGGEAKRKKPKRA
jgi:hypothetical protein